MTLRIRTYSELRDLCTFKDRYRYLRLEGKVGDATFGYDRYLNQTLYKSREWSQIRDIVIVRDNGCDLGMPGFEIHNRIVIHHMNPITMGDIQSRSKYVLEPEFLICVSVDTHLAIHFSDESLLPKLPVNRRPGDTKLW